jgi:2-amino-4-hydroxy-6-hydroxymethyldihydropteridine diphosphokinase
LEIDLGREKSFRYGPRVIDIDLLFIDDLVLNTPDITIPHEGIPERAFVLVPLADLAPDFKHPVVGLTVKEMLTLVDTSGVVLFSQT